jgi:hypothetical protein
MTLSWEVKTLTVTFGWLCQNCFLFYCVHGYWELCVYIMCPVISVHSGSEYDGWFFFIIGSIFYIHTSLLNFEPHSFIQDTLSFAFVIKLDAPFVQWNKHFWMGWIMFALCNIHILKIGSCVKWPNITKIPRLFVCMSISAFMYSVYIYLQ